MRGEQVTLHIFQPTFVDEETLSNSPARGPKVHFTECKTIERMRGSGRFDKYVTATRKDGLFSVQPLVSRSHTQSTETMEARLLPCKNCLAALNYEGWLALGESRQRQVLNNFSFEELHENFRFIFRCLPLYTTGTFPSGNYPHDWAKRSLKIRQDANWLCFCCRLDCSADHGLLHVHHKSGNKGDCRPSNLTVICADCHKARPYHDHMKIGQGIHSRLKALRALQGLPPLCGACGI